MKENLTVNCPAKETAIKFMSQSPQKNSYKEYPLGLCSPLERTFIGGQGQDLRHTSQSQTWAVPNTYHAPQLTQGFPRKMRH